MGQYYFGANNSISIVGQRRMTRLMPSSCLRRYVRFKRGPLQSWWDAQLLPSRGRLISSGGGRLSF